MPSLSLSRSPSACRNAFVLAWNSVRRVQAGELHHTWQSACMRGQNERHPSSRRRGPKGARERPALSFSFVRHFRRRAYPTLCTSLLQRATTQC